MKNGERQRWLAVAVTFFWMAGLSGCAVSRHQTAVGGNEVSAFMDRFMEYVVEDDWESAFAEIDINSLVNYGRPQGEFYLNLPKEKKMRYRGDFIQGIYLYLYRDTPRDKAPAPRLYLSEDPLSVEVSGVKNNKRLHFHLEGRPDGLKIVRVEKKADPPHQYEGAPGE